MPYFSDEVVNQAAVVSPPAAKPDSPSSNPRNEIPLVERNPATRSVAQTPTTPVELSSFIDCPRNLRGYIWDQSVMSEPQDIDSPIATSEGNINNSISTSVPDEGENMKILSNEKDEEIQKSESIEDPEILKRKDLGQLGTEETSKVDNKITTRDSDSVVTSDPPRSPMSNSFDRSKAGECNMLPVLVERLRSALEQSCSSPSLEGSDSMRPEVELREWASGIGDTKDRDDSRTPRGLKLDLKFLEDLLLSDIQTALGRLQETLIRVDIGTLTRYSSTLDPTNKLNLLKLISSLLASLKIPEDSEVSKPEKTTKISSTSGSSKRRRSDRHTIAVTTEELARARKWLEDKSVVTKNPITQNDVTGESEKSLGSDNRRENVENSGKENTSIRLERDEKQYPTVPEKHMKDALNQQQSMQNKNGKDISYQDTSGMTSGEKIVDSTYEDETTINDVSSSISSIYNRGNCQTKSNKYLAKKSKIKRANTIDIPNYLKLQAESLTNGVGPLRRPIDIGDKYSHNGGHVVPSFEPKTENDRKFLALINRNNEAAQITVASSLPFKSFNYRQIASDADKNWNSRFSNIKTTFDKPRLNEREENTGNSDVIVGSLRLPYKQKSAGFSHAPTSPFQKIEKPNREETIPGFLKPGYLPKTGSALLAKVKMFDQESSESGISPDLFPLPIRAHAKRQSKKAPNFFHDQDKQGVISNFGKSRSSENPNLNYQTFCKQFAPFVTKNPAEHQKSNIWSNDLVNGGSKLRFQENRENKSNKPKQTQTNPNKQQEEKKRDEKVPVAYRTSDFRTARSEDRQNRKLYDTCDLHENGGRDVVAYPFEVNYQKRGSFDKYREATPEKNDFSNDRHHDRSSPLSSLRYIKSILPSAPSPPRDASSTQSVAVQTHRDPFTPIYPSIVNPGNESSIFRRLANAEETLTSRDEVRRNEDDQRGVTRSYDDHRRPSRDPDSTAFAVYPNQSQGHQTLPQYPSSHVSHPPNRYPTIMDYETQYYTAIEQPAILAPPQITGIAKDRPIDRYEEYEKPVLYEDNNRVVGNYRNRDFHHRDNEDPVGATADHKTPIESNRDVPSVDKTGLVGSSVKLATYGHEKLKSRDEDLSDVSGNLSFPEAENIQNQDISSTDGVVTRYACAIATVSPVPESPPPFSREPGSSDLLDDKSQSYQLSRDSEDSVATPFYRDETPLDQARRHNLLQQSLIRQLQRDRTETSNLRRLSQETYSEDSGTSKTRYPNKSEEFTLPALPRRIFQKCCVEEAPRDVSGQPNLSNLSIDQPDRSAETVIESNNTQDKINIFEERNNSMRNHHHHQRFKPLSIPQRGTFVTPKINVVSPSKVFKPSFKGDADSRGVNKMASVDSSDEYLMSCASKPSRSIVLSKSESWHQLAFSKNTLQVPQAQPCALLKPPKPKSPSSIKLSKQYEASSSSDAIRKMEEKIQRYFQGTGNTDSSVPPKDAKTKRNFNSRKSQGNLMRSQTMPHIYDESTDVDKAFDSLFKEATRSDNRS